MYQLLCGFQSQTTWLDQQVIVLNTITLVDVVHQLLLVRRPQVNSQSTVRVQQITSYASHTLAPPFHLVAQD